jgi:hypothetical protein
LKSDFGGEERRGGYDLNKQCVSISMCASNPDGACLVINMDGLNNNVKLFD